MIVIAPQDTLQDDDISNDAFFPAVNLQTLRLENRIDSTISVERLRAAVIESMANVNQQLAKLKVSALEAGSSTLNAIQAEKINNKSILEHRYLRAVGCLTKANLIERYRDFDSTTQGNRNADELLPNIDELRRDAYWAVCDMLGAPRVTVELI